MPHRKKHRGRLPLFLLVLVLLFVGWTQLRPLPSPSAALTLKVPAVAAKKVELPWPSYGQAAIGTSGYGIIATHGQQKAVPTASLAKVITALAVLRQYPLSPNESGPTITIKQADVDSYNKYVGLDGSVVPVNVGEQITERQALEALLLPSANNMAETLARWAFGSIKSYNSYATSYAHGLGLQSVTVTDPSGFQPTTVASAQDMTILGEVAMLNPVFSQIVAEPSAVVPPQNTIRNYNLLLGNNGNVGIKTGNNDQDKGAFLFANKVTVGEQTIYVVGAVMDGPNLETVLGDAGKLASAAQTEFSQTTFVRSGQVVASYTLPDGKKVAATAANDLTTVTWNGATASVSDNIKPLKLPSPSGTNVGQVVVVSSLSQGSASAAVQTQAAAAKPNWYWRLTNPVGR